MTSLYDLTFPPLIASLKTEQNLLAKAEEYAAEKGIDVQELLDTRLAPDMWPLSQQFTITALHAVMTVVKLAGVTPNSVQFGPANFENAKKYLTETIATLESIKPEQVNGKETETVKAQLGAAGEVDMKAIDYVQGYLIPNVLFHVTTAYDILRMKGLTLAKIDYLKTFIKMA